MSRQNSSESKRERSALRSKRKYIASRRIPFGGILPDGCGLQRFLNPFPTFSLNAWFMAMHMLAGG